MGRQFLNAGLDKMKLPSIFKRSPPDVVEVTKDNVENWPKWKALFDAGKILSDERGRLRYPHGAPVGRMMLTGTDKDGTPIYRESTDEWFDPDSPKAEAFEWSK